MQERLRAIWDKIKEWWGKLNNTQRGLLIGGTIGIIIVIIVLSIIFGRTEYVTVRTCESASEAVEVRTILEDAGISCTVDQDYQVKVAQDDETEAILQLGSSNISADGYSLDDATSSSLTTTEAVQNTKLLAYQCSKIANVLIKSVDAITNAQVVIQQKDTSNNIFSDDQDYYLSAVLTLRSDLTEDQCETIGKFLATCVGSDSGNTVFVMDSALNTLYSSGNTVTSTTGSTAAQKVRAIFENAVITKATAIFTAAGYTSVSVLPALDVDFDEVEVVEDRYYRPDGSDDGLYKTSYTINSEGSVADASGTAGSESNDDDTSYYIENSDGSTSTYVLEQYEWYQDEVVTTTKPASGTVTWADSSMAIAATKTVYLTEDMAESLGYLEDMTWDEFKNENGNPTEVELEDEVVSQYKSLLSAGSGIPVANIDFICYQDYFFVDSAESSVNIWLIVQIALAVLIALALVFIILRSMRPVAVEETEPELSVEDMLATTKQQQEAVADIDLQDKSETRKAIEKFVNENPESVALLLRNWLNEGWG